MDLNRQVSGSNYNRFHKSKTKRKAVLREFRLPWYARATVIILGIILVTAVLFLGRDIFVPLAFAALLSVLLYPLSNFLERHKVPRLLSIFIAVAIASIVLACLAAIIAMQIGQFGEEFPRIKKESMEYIDGLQLFMRDTWGIAYADQLRWFQQWGAQTWQRSGEVLNQALLTFVDITTLVVLVPLYTFLMLMYKDLIIEFFYRLVARKNAGTLKKVLQESRMVVNRYIVGLMIETVIIAVLNSAALLLLGIDYAILFGILAALLNLIPYIGIMIGGLLPLLMALITKDSAWYPVGVLAAFSVIQIIDNNLVVPYIVAARVSINALISIVAVIIGGMLWGISGMFLSLPAVAILKIVFDRVEPLKPWGLILGDVIPPKRTGKATKR
ncbi:MAG: AI-2E family transporter [Ignavibacteriae bacterium]|nr:MAG: AI-2E family transporter [Ignavibacteriota bacterium]